MSRFRHPLLPRLLCFRRTPALPPGTVVFFHLASTGYPQFLHHVGRIVGRILTFPHKKFVYGKGV